MKNTKKSTILSSFTAACTLYKNESVKNQVEAIIDQGVYAESMHGFFEKIDAMKDPEYKATEDDILRFRHKTTDLEELVYDASDFEVALRFIDCGGQRDLRERWTQFAIRTWAMFRWSFLSWRSMDTRRRYKRIKGRTA